MCINGWTDRGPVWGKDSWAKGTLYQTGGRSSLRLDAAFDELLWPFVVFYVQYLYEQNIFFMSFQIRMVFSISWYARSRTCSKVLGRIECMRCRLLLPMIAASVCQSVTRLNSASLCKNGRTDQDPVWGEHFWGPKEHSDPHSKGGVDSIRPSPQITLAFCSLFVVVLVLVLIGENHCYSP